MVPFVIGFNIESRPGEALYGIDRFVDSLFILDILLNFITVGQRCVVLTQSHQVFVDPEC